MNIMDEEGLADREKKEKAEDVSIEPIIEKIQREVHEKSCAEKIPSFDEMKEIIPLTTGGRCTTDKIKGLIKRIVRKLLRIHAKPIPEDKDQLNTDAVNIIQIVSSISYGDAVGNDVRAIKQILTESGYANKIYAESIDDRLPAGTASPIIKMPKLKSNDIIIYHGAIGTKLNYMLPEYGGRKVMIYHNITPPGFFNDYSLDSVRATCEGLKGIRFLSNKLDHCIAVSEFNKQDMLDMGYTCPIDVCPILIPFEDYDQKPSQDVLTQYQGDGITNLMFAGRIAPNKKQEDIIAAFYCYHKYYNSKSRLFLVGSWSGMEKYYQQLCRYVDRLGISESVIFSGHVKFDEILAYYKLADVFVCMSEHEGFCVPLVEAMYFDVPIVAFKSTAIPYTMGYKGALLDNKEPNFVAAVIDRVINDKTLNEKLLKLQRERLKDFSYTEVKSLFLGILNRIVEEGN